MNENGNRPAPILSIRRRGAEIESVHRGAIVLLEVERERAVGDASAPIFTRSCTKPFQAIACLASGAADRFQLSPAELALACSSHNGSPEHRSLVLQMLHRGGLSPSLLRCGASEPFGDAERTIFLQKNETPDAATHNCSGKHAAFLLTQMHLGGDPNCYLDPESPLQKLVRACVSQALDVSESDLGSFVDGCSAPTFRPPLRALAAGFVKLANPELASPNIAKHLERLRDAIISNPVLYSGSDRICAAILRVSGGRVIPKNGAEGVYAFGVRGRRAGFAIKVEDGASRGYTSIVVDTLDRHGFISKEEWKQLREFTDLNLYNAAGLPVGREEIVARV